MLAGVMEKHHKMVAKAIEVIRWAENRNIIDGGQRQILVEEIARKCKV